MERNHIAIYVSANHNKEAVIQQITKGQLLTGNDHSNAELYSSVAINEFVNEETRHEHVEVRWQNRGLNTMSDGEKKKALLSYIIAKKPSCIIVDNIFDSLDIQAQADIAANLTQLSNNITLVQVTNRISDILPFIKNIFTINNTVLEKIENINAYRSSNKHHFIHAIPPPLHEAAEEDDPLIQFNNVSVSYDERPIITNINWTINKGEFWQLVGPNGAGKSTILSMINGDNPKAYGQDIILFGKKKGSGETVWQIKEKIGYFSSAVGKQFERLDSIENMLIGGFNDSVGLYVKPTELQINLADEWLFLLGLYEVKNKPFLNLSIAHQRLLLVARAMVKHPPLLILDEPISGLNDTEIELVTSLINKFTKESKTTVIYVSHRNEESLSPGYIFELTPSENGSTGKVITL
ncbi:ATP-binding cassette domain-containing protein [Ferruginibacter albus]|uniref:ATP-binding cassette domain-containing protein n=1 Tax=Ferruginibacter albus TaxID=2875540 RepID=UPI001CC4520D|nr:ATP-binding cassette domain-containing protein [Ferruginibacter albus]UAY50929.1 ATP-binding cassette domain-containing protein [Ferruginibacter albus]